MARGTKYRDTEDRTVIVPRPDWQYGRPARDGLEREESLGARLVPTPTPLPRLDLHEDLLGRDTTVQTLRHHL